MNARERIARHVQGRQLLRIFTKAPQERGDRSERLGGGRRFGVRTRHCDRGLSRVSGSRCDGGQQQGPARDRLAMPIGSARRTNIVHQS